MKLSQLLENALNEQLHLELSSSYVYMGIAAYFAPTPFSGFAKWMEVQTKEESEHAHKFFKYIIDRGGKVTLKALAEPKNSYASPLAAFQTSLAHEQHVSASISKLYELAQSEKDFPTLSFLQWFLSEQVEEEKNVSEMVAKLEMVGDNRNGIFQVDKLAGKRGA